MSAKEMYDEIATLLGLIGKALEVPDDQVATAVEEGRITLDTGVDERGERYVRASCVGRAARIYDGAILYEEGATEPQAEEGHGCSCGR